MGQAAQQAPSPISRLAIGRNDSMAQAGTTTSKRNAVCVKLTLKSVCNAQALLQWAGLCSKRDAGLSPRASHPAQTQHRHRHTQHLLAVAVHAVHERTGRRHTCVQVDAIGGQQGDLTNAVATRQAVSGCGRCRRRCAHLQVNCENAVAIRSVRIAPATRYLTNVCLQL